MADNLFMLLYFDNNKQNNAEILFHVWNTIQKLRWETQTTLQTDNHRNLFFSQFEYASITKILYASRSIMVQIFQWCRCFLDENLEPVSVENVVFVVIRICIYIYEGLIFKGNSLI